MQRWLRSSSGNDEEKRRKHEGGKKLKAYLCLQDGTVFAGESIGLTGEASGEVCFNTSITGYQEIITDPSCVGQIIVFTYPLLGNYGVNPLDAQSAKVQASGIVIKEAAHYASNYRARQSLHSYLAEQGVVGIKDIDTRALTRHLRDHGTMPGIISTEEDLAVLRQKAQGLKPVVGPELVQGVTTKGKQVFSGGQYPVVLLNFGVKKGIIEALQAADCQVTVVGAGTPAEEILALNPAGVFLSGGPGDPRDVAYALPVIKEIMGQGIPLMGVGLGHLLFGLALGGTVSALKHGHRGDYPVKDLRSNRIYITAQNHGYVLEQDSLATEELEITHLNLHDQTVEGLRHKPSGSFSVQFNPEAQPGPQEAKVLFQQFVELLAEKQQDRRGGR